MITKLSNNTHRQATKAYKFNKISNHRLILSFKEYMNFIKRRDVSRRPFRCCTKWPKRFNWFNNTDTFANFVSDSNSYKLTGLPFSLALSRIHDECSYEEH